MNAEVLRGVRLPELVESNVRESADDCEGIVPLKRLLDKLRVIPQTGKHTIVETKPWKEYTIGVLPGRRGGVVELTGEIYPTREDAEHAIFLKRLKALCEHYGIDMEV